MSLWASMTKLLFVFIPLIDARFNMTNWTPSISSQ
jgi:hypothetical protein